MQILKTISWIRGTGLLCLFAALCLPALGSASPYKEKAGAKDHPLVGRFQGSVLYNHGVLNFDHVDVPVSAARSEAVEGKVFNYYYVAPQDRTDLEVFRNYQMALEKNRFKILFACDAPPQCHAQGLYKHAQYWTGKSGSFAGGYDALSYMGENGNYPPRFLSAKLERPEGNVFVVLTVQGPSSTQKDKGAGGPYFLQVIETTAMETGNVTINADALRKGIAAEGKIALYGIYFDTGKAEIKPESKPQLDEMARLLGEQKNLKVYIVGHTDNQGSLEGNLALSLKRAEAISAALVRDYKVDARRLMARGAANFSPVASNAAEAGRAKNRRVEMVEQ